MDDRTTNEERARIRHACECCHHTVQRDNRLEVRVQFVRPIEFPGYTYNYEFDHTVKSTAFLASNNEPQKGTEMHAMYLMLVFVTFVPSLWLNFYRGRAVEECFQLSRA